MARRTVKVNVGKGYEVIIENGILKNCGSIVKNTVGKNRAAVITDSNVAKLYLDTVIESLKNVGIEYEYFVFEAGEKSKNISTLSDILEFLAEKKFVRSDTIIALGGGVTGDMAGFASAVYLRGIKFIQIPTTLLAAVDSSVGGKTAIDLSAGKNLAGAFKQPEAVICDPETLSTLPEHEFANGMAETIKYGILFSEELFETFEKEPTADNLCEMIEKCVAFKGRTVENDEFDNGERKLLNLGHTIGHAIEKCSNFAITHGHAVAAGTAMIARAGEALGLTEKGTAARAEYMLKKYSLPTDSDYSVEDLTAAALSDKKRAGDKITLVVPVKIGECILKNEPVEALEKYIRLGKEK